MGVFPGRRDKLLKWRGGVAIPNRARASSTFTFDPLWRKPYGHYPLWQKNSVT